MTRFVFLLLAGIPLLAADANDIALSIVLDGLEMRYNRAKTLQVSFEESYMGSGRPRRAESGELSLRKPGKMRWEYSQPAGKLFLSDGKTHLLLQPDRKSRREDEVEGQRGHACAARLPAR